MSHYASLQPYKDAHILLRAPGQGTTDIPVRYEIVRERYRLILRMDPNWSEPGFDIYFEPDQHETIDFGPANGGSSPCAAWQLPPGTRTWNVRLAARCAAGRFIRFKVLDNQGNVLGVEAIPYTVHFGSIHTQWDGL